MKHLKRIARTMPKCEHTDFRFHPGIVIDLNGFYLLVFHPNIFYTALKLESDCGNARRDTSSWWHIRV